jgi:hypothetical protein
VIGNELGSGGLPFGHAQLRNGRLENKAVARVLPHHGEHFGRIAKILHSEADGLAHSRDLRVEGALEM